MVSLAGNFLLLEEDERNCRLAAGWHDLVRVRQIIVNEKLTANQNLTNTKLYRTHFKVDFHPFQLTVFEKKSILCPFSAKLASHKSS